MTNQMRNRPPRILVAGLTELIEAEAAFNGAPSPAETARIRRNAVGALAYARPHMSEELFKVAAVSVADLAPRAAEEVRRRRAYYGLSYARANLPAELTQAVEDCDWDFVRDRMVAHAEEVEAEDSDESADCDECRGCGSDAEECDCDECSADCDCDCDADADAEEGADRVEASADESMDWHALGVSAFLRQSQGWQHSAFLGDIIRCVREYIEGQYC